MNNLIPYISSEPPPILNDSFDQETYDTEACYQFESNEAFTSVGLPEVPMEIEEYVNQNIQQNDPHEQYCNFGRDNNLDGIRSPTELAQYIDCVVIKNNLSLDVTDSNVNVDYKDSESVQSFEGQFDDYIDHSCYETVSIKQESTLNVLSDGPDNNMSDGCIKTSTELEQPEVLNEECLENDDFCDFPPIVDSLSTDYFQNANTGKLSDNLIKTENFADFSSINYTQLENSIQPTSIENKFESGFKDNGKIDNGDDDDFEDFATFESPVEISAISNEKLSSKNSDDALKSLLETFNSFESELILPSNLLGISSIIRSDSFISHQTIFDDIGLAVWKELINYDYSPAFIFQWMQSATYEKFMSSLGSEYREMLSYNRATLPLYSVNLTPIEPVPIDNFSQFNISASSSNIDLASKDEPGVCLSEKSSSNIDFKNLEEEFVFNQFSNTSEVKCTGDSSTSDVSAPVANISSTVIQTDRFGGILKSLLKPLNPTKTASTSKPLNPQAEAVLKELPDLSYMSSKVLMFPVISNCDVEDNI